MAISTNSPDKTTTDPQTPNPDNNNNNNISINININNNPNPNPSKPDLPNSSAPLPPPPSSTVPPLNPNPNPNPILNNSQPTAITTTTATPPPPPQIQSFLPAGHPSFRPTTLPVPHPTAAAPHFSPIPNPSFQNHGVPVQVQPPGVMVQPPGSGAMPQMMQPHYGQQTMRMYAPMPNGYPMGVPQGAMNPPGILRYAPPTYPQMLRPPYPQRPPGAGVIPTLQRPPVMAMRGPVIPTIVRPPINLAIAQIEKPMTTIYVGKIASTVDNDFMLSLLQLCGPVKSWKRVPDPTTGALKGFGFCEFESVEGVLRALRLLSKLSIDGQELMLNFDKATKEYLKRFVEKKKESSKDLKATDDTEGAGKEEKATSPKPSVDESKEEDNNNNNEATKEDDYATFGLVTNEDKEADKEASEKLSAMIEERIKNKPLPPPPPPPQTAPDVGGNSTSEHPEKSKDGGDSDADAARTEDKKDEEMTSQSKPTNENEKLETSSPDRNSRKERERTREKERELERYEREREQERAKREREREYKIREEERRYRARLKEWENREKEKERARKMEREREKDREQDRKYEIMEQENDDGYSKKRKYRNSGDEREERKRRLREKEEDMDDKIKELEEIAEAKRKEEEEREKQKEQQKHALEILSGNNSNAANGIENAMLVDGSLLETKNKPVAHQSTDVEMEHVNEIANKITQNGTSDDSETRQNNSLGPKKLGFGLVGSGKRTTVPSLFHEEDEDAQKDKKMRPLVPIDYSTEELQAVRETTPVPPSNLAAAAEFAKRIGEKPDSDRERSRRTHDRSSHRDRDHETNRARDETREKEKAKTPDNKKLLDAKQLIDTIPKTKDELFSYPINWVVYDKNGLHERMRPWISKKITEFLGEEETTLVDYIVSSTQEHVTADEMLDRLQSILDDEAEMFVLKMWRMLIFEIKKVETGLAGRSKA